MKKLLTLLALAALLLVGCADMNDPGSTLATEDTSAMTTAPVTTLDRDTLTNPQQFTEDEIEIITAMWERWKKNRPDSTCTIDEIAALLPKCSLISCANGYVLELIIDYDEVAFATTTERIGEYEFRHSYVMALDYYLDGEFYLLKDAYANGLLTDDQLGVAWEEFKAKYPSRYESTDW